MRDIRNRDNEPWFDALARERAKRCDGYAGLIYAAETGDEEAARSLIRAVASLIGNHPERIPAPIREYIGAALTQILAGEDPAVALNLKVPAGERIDYWKLERDASIAIAIERERTAPGKKTTLDNAKAIVEKAPQVRERTTGRVGTEAFQKIYYRFFPKAPGKS